MSHRKELHRQLDELAHDLAVSPAYAIDTWHLDPVAAECVLALRDRMHGSRALVYALFDDPDGRPEVIDRATIAAIDAFAAALGLAPWGDQEGKGW